LEAPSVVPVVGAGGGVFGASLDGAALGLTGVPGLVATSPPAVGGGFGLFVAGAALGLTGVPGLVAGSRSVGAALGLATRVCASRLQTSKSVWVGSAASARVAKASRLTPNITKILADEAHRPTRFLM
jgi:hypothetical protein